MLRAANHGCQATKVPYEGLLPAAPRGGDVTLDTRWRILGRAGDELAFGRSTITEAAGGPGYPPMIAAMARALGTLGREIAAEIRVLPR